jgi:o-succinylbenzoate synthase
LDGKYKLIFVDENLFLKKRLLSFMAIAASFQKHTLNFTFAAGTSRGILKQKKTWIINIIDDAHPEVVGSGEAAPLVKLSIDDVPDFDERLQAICDLISGQSMPAIDELYALLDQTIPADLPAVYFGFEVAFLDLINGGKHIIYDNAFSRGEVGIPINGLVWMGALEDMLFQITEKVDEGFDCIKVKIGSMDFEKECDLLQYIRSKYYKLDITLRVDANGAFDPDEALEKLEELSKYNLHSIEQPIKAGQPAAMYQLCRQSLVPIALDEELIGIPNREAKVALLEAIKPQYIILKPTLVGGLRSCREWIAIAEELKIGWWITSALESNVGLNAISQFTAEFNTDTHHGLGTGKLYHNNFSSPLTIEKDKIYYRAPFDWDLSLLT